MTLVSYPDIIAVLTNDYRLFGRIGRMDLQVQVVDTIARERSLRCVHFIDHSCRTGIGMTMPFHRLHIADMNCIILIESGSHSQYQVIYRVASHRGQLRHMCQQTIIYMVRARTVRACGIMLFTDDLIRINMTTTRSIPVPTQTGRIRIGHNMVFPLIELIVAYRVFFFEIIRLADLNLQSEYTVTTALSAGARDIIEDDRIVLERS